MGRKKWVESASVPWVESSPFRNWVERNWVDLEKCQVQGRQHIDFDPSPFDPIRPKLFDQKGRPNSFRPISFDPFHAIHFRNRKVIQINNLRLKFVIFCVSLHEILNANAILIFFNLRRGNAAVKVTCHY